MRLLVALAALVVFGSAQAQYMPHDPMNVANTPRLSRADRQRRSRRLYWMHTTPFAPGSVFLRWYGRINLLTWHKTWPTI
jgi:hypothetical protein